MGLFHGLASSRLRVSRVESRPFICASMFNVSPVKLTSLKFALSGFCEIFSSSPSWPIDQMGCGQTCKKDLLGLRGDPVIQKAKGDADFQRGRIFDGRHLTLGDSGQAVISKVAGRYRTRSVDNDLTTVSVSNTHVSAMGQKPHLFDPHYTC